MTTGPIAIPTLGGARVAAAPYDPNAEYDVKVTRPLVYGAAHILPLHDHIMTGGFLALIVKEYGADAVHVATLRK